MNRIRIADRLGFDEEAVKAEKKKCKEERKMFDIAALGEILIDFTPLVADGSEKAFVQNPGGAPANVLAVVAKRGGNAAFIGKVGRDTFGEYLKNVLEDFGIDTRALVFDAEHNTTLAFVSLDKNGDREFSFYRRFGADLFLEKKDVDLSVVTSAKIFHFGSLSLTDEPARSATEYAIKRASLSGATITFDPNYRAMLWESPEKAAEVIREFVPKADVIKISREEAVLITGKENIADAAAELEAMGPKIVLLTDGANGAYYRYKGETVYVPAIPVDTIDTTGAGDIFFGTFLSEIIRRNKTNLKLDRDELSACVRSATVSAAISTTKKGAIPSIP